MLTTSRTAWHLPVTLRYAAVPRVGCGPHSPGSLQARQHTDSLKRSSHPSPRIAGQQQRCLPHAQEGCQRKAVEHAASTCLYACISMHAMRGCREMPEGDLASSAPPLAQHDQHSWPPSTPVPHLHNVGAQVLVENIGAVVYHADLDLQGLLAGARVAAPRQREPHRQGSCGCRAQHELGPPTQASGWLRVSWLLSRVQRAP